MKTKTTLSQSGKKYLFILGLILLCSTSGWAQNPTLNEVRIESNISPLGEDLFTSIELFNSSGTSIDLTDYILVANDGTVLDTLPAWILPDNAWIVVHFGTGTDDSDFSDNLGNYYSQGPTGVLDTTEDAIGLYHPTVDPADIVDYVNWTANASFTGGPTHDDAVASAIWGDTDFVDISAIENLSTIGLSPDGFDNNVSSDWVEIKWVTQISTGFTPVNPLLVAPANGLEHLPNLVNFVWLNVNNALNFRIEVALDIDFLNIIHVEVLNDPFFILNLPDGMYFWRVIVFAPDGTIINPNPAPWIVPVGPVPPPGPNNGNQLAVPHYFQHKDTEMLCISSEPAYFNPPLRRPGCNENAGNTGPWDGAHPANHATNCNHCGMYCVRASIQMINHFHKGAGADMSQDRLSVQACGGLHPGPEQDLGHARGLLWATETPNTYSWALGGVQVTQDNSPSFNEMKTEIDAGRPVLVGNSGHAMVISGWRIHNGVNQIHLLDPWPTAPSGWMNWNVKGINKWYKPTGAIAAINQEASVTMDTDGDDVVDFDEQIRGFCSHHNNPDTDSDGVGDKQDIRSYTFHSRDHANGHVSIMGGYVAVNSAQFPDIDGDGLRAECDCDTDGDGDLDGNEDINVNGNSPEANETCVYDFQEKDIDMDTDKDEYDTSEDVLLSGGTLRKNHSFNYQVIDECDPIEDGTAITPDGQVTTDDEGNFDDHSLGTFDIGWHQVILDADNDGVYNSQGCPDLTVCFEVVGYGCCWNCETIFLACNGQVLEEDCPEGWTWVEGAECGTSECAEEGCTDSSACNYNSTAVCDNGLCYYYGCTDPLACNFDPFAGCDDDSCYYYGCMDSTACNYDSNAGCDDGSCYYYGCTDPYACNYDSIAGCDDESCYYGTCMDPQACNYDNSGLCEDNSLCQYPSCDDPVACNYDPNAACGDPLLCIYDDCGGCTDPFACNWLPNATFDDGSCTYPGCTDLFACNWDPFAGCEDGSCTYWGCTVSSACNYDSTAGCDDGSCIFPGCDDPFACNYDPFAGCSDGSCTYPGCNDPFACNYDLLAGCFDGSCTYPGCMDATANNYDPLAGCDDGSCTYDPYGCSDIAACNYDSLATGLIGCTYPGCTDALACNYNQFAGCEDFSCYYPTCVDPFACNYDPAGCFGGVCLYPGCTDPTANNYDPFAGCEDGSCTYDSFGCSDPFACNYDSLATGLDCIYPGCDDPSACNYDSTVGCDDGSCLYYDICGICGGIAITAGCLDPFACNYDSSADCDNNSCLYDCYGCTDPLATNYDPSALIDDGSCVYLTGCTNPAACNYDPTAMTDDGSCDYSCYGCTDSFAINFDPGATIDDGSCVYVTGCMNPFACNFDPTAQFDDGSCDYSCYGCTDPLAINYDITATIDDGSCVYLVGCTNPAACNYDPTALTDDGSCDYSCYGCTDPFATNYNSSATIDDGTCVYQAGCMNPFACNYDPTAQFDDGSCEYDCYGCTDPLAINYNSTATIDDGSCIYLVGCTYPDAVNYDSTALFDDGTCIFNIDTCPGDFDGSGEINTADLLIMLGVFGTICP